MITRPVCPPAGTPEQLIMQSASEHTRQSLLPQMTNIRSCREQCATAVLPAECHHGVERARAARLTIS